MRKTALVVLLAVAAGCFSCHKQYKEKIEIKEKHGYQKEKVKIKEKY